MVRISNSVACLRSLTIGVGLLAMLGSAAVIAAPAREKSKPAAASTTGASTLEVIPVRDNVYMLSSKNSTNVTLQFGPDGVLMVNTATAELTDAIYAEIKRHSQLPIRIVINTDAHLENVGGNEAFARKLGGEEADRPAVGMGSIPGALIYAHENASAELSQGIAGKSVPAEAWPTETYFGAETELYFNGEAIKLFYEPAAHTDADSIVYFRRSDVISTGDVFSTESYPFIDLEHGGTINGVLDALNHIIQIAVPRAMQEDGTLIVPGKGRLCDEADVVEYRDMLTIIRDRMHHMKEKGMTLEQIQAAHPTHDYDGRYGSATGSWTTPDFIKAVYQTMDSEPNRVAIKSDVVREKGRE